jgi:hypothetical protein
VVPTVTSVFADVATTIAAMDSQAIRTAPRSPSQPSAPDAAWQLAARPSFASDLGRMHV